MPMAMVTNMLVTLILGFHGESHGEPISWRMNCFDGKHIYNTIADKCIGSEAVKRMSNLLKAHKVDPEKDYVIYQECMCGPVSSCGGPITCGPACTAANCCGVQRKSWRGTSSEYRRCYEQCSLYKEAIFAKADIHTCFPIITTTAATKRGTCGDIGIAAISFCPNSMTFDMASAKRECAGAVCDNKLVADVDTCCLPPNPGYVYAFACPRRKCVVNSQVHHSTTFDCNSTCILIRMNQDLCLTPVMIMAYTYVQLRADGRRQVR